MIFTPAGIEGAFVIDLERFEDERGFFARSFCRREFDEHGLDPVIAQCNVSLNHRAGTLRGMHSQGPHHEEAKLVRCTRGSVHDVILDLRPGSSSFLEHVGVFLSATNHRMLYIPKGVFHGFLTLEDETEVYYQMSEFYMPEEGRGVRWNDPAFGIEWPAEVKVISARDATYPDYRPPTGDGSS